MNLLFFRSVRRAGKGTLPLLAGLMLFPFVVKGTDSIASFTSGDINFPPQVDATNFYNSVTWNIIPSQSLPYQTAHTLNYVNDGTMNAYLGWEFDYGPSTGGDPSSRGMSASFFNDGTIAAYDNFVINPIYLSSFASYVLVSATNIANVNGGTLVAGAGGEIVLNGENVDLSYGTLDISGLTALGSGNGPRTYSPDTAIYDEEWQQTNTFPNSTTPYAFNSLAIWDGTTATSPVYYVNSLCLSTNLPTLLQIFYFPPFGIADSTNIESELYMTNIVVTNMSLVAVTNTIPTKIFRQAVFADVGDGNISVDDRFDANSQNVSNLFRTITVKFTSAFGDTAYLMDTLGSFTNRGLLLNASVNIGDNPQNPCTDPTFRPANYILSRVDPLGTFGGGIGGLGPPDTNFFYNPTLSNVVVQAEYAGYGGYVDDLVRDPLSASLTNLPGQVKINATNLDLTWSTITSAGAEIVVHAKNLIGSDGALVSCRNISYNLGSDSHSLNVTNLATTSPVPGFHGNIYAWSGVWTNGLITVFTNYSQVTNTEGPPTLTNNVFTNITEMDFHVLMVDGTSLLSTEPVRVQDLILESNAVNMSLSDPMTVMHTLFFGGQSLTIQPSGSLRLGGLTSYGDLRDWNSSIAPSLLYFTNNGSLFVPRAAHFGDDRATNYAAFVNRGTINVGGGESIDSTYYQDSGTENASTGYFVTTSTGKVENASITSGQDINFTANSLKLDNSTLSAGSRLNFFVTDPATGSLYDSGGSASNALSCVRGFNLWEKPATGDLLGTKIDAFSGSVITNVWAGEDFGAATTAGYSNNVALGQLLLSPQGAPRFPQRFIFKGVSANNALYVDLLDLSQISSNNLAAALAMDPNIIVYYAAAKLSFTPPPANGVPQEPEEYLNGMFGGHLLWVTNFAGPNSSVDVIINGQTYAVNRALRYSKIIDSNGNGIPNYYDANPFNTPPSGSVPQLTLAVSLMPQGQSATNNTVQSLHPSSVATLSWLAAPNTVYQLQYTTNLSPEIWLPLLDYTNTASTNRIVTVQDTNALSGQRFYRISRP